MSAAIVRQWLVLSLLPKPPRKIDTAFIESELRARGVAVHRRTIQRDLVELSQVFPLVSDARAKPYGWRWSEDATFLGSLPVPTEQPSSSKTGIEVRLRGRPVIVQSALERLRVNGARVAADPRDASLAVATARVDDTVASRRILLAYADEIEILAPPSVRKDIATRAQRAASRHEK